MLYSDTFITVYSIFVAAVLGAVLGSFLNCAAYRIAHNESFLKGRSKCPDCGHELGILDLFPIFSWLFLRGKCRYCGAKVSVRYFITECLFALISVLCLLASDISLLYVRNMIFLSCLFCLSLVDLETYTIPDGCHIISIIAWAAYLPFSGWSWAEIGLHALAGVVFGGGVLLISLIMDKLLRKESLGGGDVKLFFVMGLYLGLIASLFSMVLACVIGLIFAFVRHRETEQIPFGPSIAAATAVTLLWGDVFVNWYLGLFSF